MNKETWIKPAPTGLRTAGPMGDIVKKNLMLVTKGSNQTVRSIDLFSLFCLFTYLYSKELFLSNFRLFTRICTQNLRKIKLGLPLRPEMGQQEICSWRNTS